MFGNIKRNRKFGVHHTFYGKEMVFHGLDKVDFLFRSHLI